MKPIGTHNYYVYILTNLHKAVLYNGVTNSLSKRVHDHREEAASGSDSFTGRYCCIYLVYYERFQYINKAIAREKERKKGMDTEEKGFVDQQFQSQLDVSRSG